MSFASRDKSHHILCKVMAAIRLTDCSFIASITFVLCLRWIFVNALNFSWQFPFTAYVQNSSLYWFHSFVFFSLHLGSFRVKCYIFYVTIKARKSTTKCCKSLLLLPLTDYRPLMLLQHVVGVVPWLWLSPLLAVAF